MIATSQFTISVIKDGKDGAPGATGPQGVSVTKVVEEYRLSNSSTELTGSGTGYTWSETKPDIPSGKYLWIRERTDLSNNTSSYGTAHCDIVISGLVQDVDRNSNAITSKVWESDITTKINEYDGSTGAAIRNRVSQTETNISGITSRVSDVESETDSLGTRMTSAESAITQNANNIQSKVSQDGVISAINQSAESILISASKVDIQGAVSFSSLDSTLQGRITGVESTASTANTTANTANATANTALKGMKVYSGTCSTAAGTAAKVVSCSDTDFEMTNGTTITIKFSTASTVASPTLNVNTKGAKAIYFDGAEVSSSNIFRWQAGSVITFQYDGTHWVVMAYQNLDYFICSTAAGTTAKATNSVTGTFVLCKGTTITVFFGTSNSVNAPTLNVGSTGAYAIYYKNAVTSANNQYLWSVNTTVNFTFNGSYWYVNDGGAQLAKDYAKTAVDWVGTNGTTVVSAADIMKTWTDDATLATTTIDGGYIKTHTIESTHLATNAIMSQNYSRTDTTSPYSSTGAFLDLETGTLYMRNFGVNGTTGTAYFNGTVNANAGKFGDSTSYWNIETVYDYNMQPHAALVGTGSPYLQTGNWQVSDNAVATRKYVSTSDSAGTVSYYKDTASNTFYDAGMKIPTSFTKGNDGSEDRYNRAFFYQRKYTGNSAPQLASEWTYPFIVDSEGRVYCTDIIITGGGTGTTYLPLAGGTITGNLSVDGKTTLSGQVVTNLLLRTNLGSTSAATLSGTANATIQPGVTGTLGVGNGGTGKSSWTQWGIVYASATNALAQIGAGTSGQILKSNGSAAPGWVNQSSIAAGSAVNDADGNPIKTTYRKLNNNDFDTINVTDLNAGNLIVTGAGRFTNGLYGDLTGNVTGNVSGTSSGVRDYGNGTNITVQYSGSGISSATWFAAWSGYNIRAISAANTRNSIEAMYYPKITTAATADTFTAEGLYRIAFSHTDSSFPVNNWGDLFVSNHGTGYQIFMGDNSMALYKRIYNNSEGTWGAWSNIWDIGAKYDGNGDTISSTYLKLSGGTLTGDLTIEKTSSISNNYPARIIFKTIQTDNNVMTSNAYISVYDDHDGASNGTNMVICSSGNVFIGSGESPGSLYSTIGKNNTGENMYITSDTSMYFETNAQTIGNRVGMILNNSHQLVPVKAEVLTNNIGSIGTATYKWANVYATTLHGNLDARTFTIGNTGKDVDWSGDVSWSKEEISDVASNTTDGWMSKDDKAKLDQITVSDIGTVGANSIKGATNGGIDVTITSGVATLKHTNQLSSGGTAQGTANNTTLTNGGSFTIPTVTYDINGHITTTGTNKLTLPNITSVSGNAGTATKFASAQSVTLTGDTTGTASSQAGWSVATTNIALSGLNSSWQPQSGSSSRPTTANVTFADNKIRYYLATSSMTEGKPVGDAHIIHMAWDNGKWDAQLAIGTSNWLQYRIQGDTDWTNPWITVLDTNNYTTYVPTKTGTGASGTWGISITGNAATATSATTATTATNAHGLSYGTSDVLDTQEKIDDFLQAGRFMASVFNTTSANNVGMQTNDGMILSASWHTSNTYGAQLAFDDNTAGVFKFRGKNKTWGDWKTVLHSGNYIDYTVPKTGGEFTGAVTGTSFAASSYISSNNGSGTAGGVNLYSRNATMEYAIMFRQTSNQVKHGYVQGDWATYLTMGGSASNVGTRGWIFKDHVNSKGVASISGAGNMALNGELAIGTTGTDVSGSCSLVMDRNLSCLNFVFN